MSQPRKFWRFKQELVGHTASGGFLDNHIYEEDHDRRKCPINDLKVKLDSNGCDNNGWRKCYFEEWIPKVGDYLDTTTGENYGCTDIRITELCKNPNKVHVVYKYKDTEIKNVLDLYSTFLVPQCCRAPYKESVTTMLPADVGPCSEPGIAIPPELETGDPITERMYLWAKSRVDDFPPLDEDGKPMVKQSYLDEQVRIEKRKTQLELMAKQENRLALTRGFEKTNPALSQTPEICIVFLDRLTKG